MKPRTCSRNDAFESHVFVVYVFAKLELFFFFEDGEMIEPFPDLNQIISCLLKAGWY
jgi:hypothetical protein